MKIIDPYVEVPNFDADAILRQLEYRGRVCYKSEDKITEDSAAKFVRSLITRGHESVLEHCSIGVKFVIDRGVSHELVRHRIGSFSQESTRFCNYGNYSNITVINPFFFVNEPGDFASAEHAKRNVWLDAMFKAEAAYLALIELGAIPQEARSVLPNSLKTEVETTFNLREWRHFFTLRAAKNAHPQMQQVAIPLLLHMRNRLPIVFDDIPFNKEFPISCYAEIRGRVI